MYKNTLVPSPFTCENGACEEHASNSHQSVDRKRAEVGISENDVVNSHFSGYILQLLWITAEGKADKETTILTKIRSHSLCPSFQKKKNNKESLEGELKVKPCALLCSDSVLQVSTK